MSAEEKVICKRLPHEKLSDKKAAEACTSMQETPLRHLSRNNLRRPRGMRQLGVLEETRELTIPSAQRGWGRGGAANQRKITIDVGILWLV